jgi:hypothetical protein
MCCVQLQSELKTAATGQNGELNLRYSGLPKVYVRGAVTGNLYPFSPAQPVQPVDPRDARFLLASPLFGLTR